jgi:hypothetical protein
MTTPAAGTAWTTDLHRIVDAVRLTRNERERALLLDRAAACAAPLDG